MAAAAAATAPAEHRSRAHVLVQANPYDVDRVLGPLEQALESQCRDGWYDADLNTALLKLYQLHPREDEKVVKTDALVRVLLKAMMQLPEPDFALAAMLVPEPLQATEVVRTLCDMADRLQSARFPEFWDLVRGNADLVRRAPGFEAAARRFVLRAVAATYREMNAGVLARYLGLQSAQDLATALEPGFSLDLSGAKDGGVVIMPSNPDNHPKPARLVQGDFPKFDAVVDAVVAELSRKPATATPGDGVSAGMVAAVTRMRKQVLEGGEA